MSENGDMQQVRLRLPKSLIDEIEAMPGATLNGFVINCVRRCLEHHDMVEIQRQQSLFVQTFALCMTTAAAMTRKPMEHPESVDLGLQLVATLAQTMRQTAPTLSKKKHASPAVVKSAMSHVMGALTALSSPPAVPTR